MFPSVTVRSARRLAVALTLAALAAPAGAHAQGCANTHVEPSRANLEAVRAAVLCLHNAERAPPAAATA